MDFVYESNISFKDENQDQTHPGYTLNSEYYSLRFVSASQQGKISPLLQLETDWKEVMMIMLTSLQTEKGVVKKVEMLMKEKLEEWSLQQQGGEDLDLKVTVKLQDNVYTLKLPESPRKLISSFGVVVEKNYFLFHLI